MSFKLSSLFYKKLQAPLMSTTLAIKAKCSQKILDQALVYAQEIESQLSVYRPSSELSHLNQNASSKEVAVSESLYALLQTALDVSTETEGCFDITIGALTQQTYKFGHKVPMLPNRSTLKKVSKTVNYHNVVLKDGKVRFNHPQTYLDLGGIGKGYCVDRVKHFLQEREVKSALVSLGGEIAAYGGQFTVGIAHPREKRLYAYFETEGETYISTSGDYERYIKDFDHNHIIDPISGRSSSRYASLTLVSKRANATLLDAYNTAMFLMDETEMEQFALAHDIAYLRLDKTLEQKQERLERFTKKYVKL